MTVQAREWRRKVEGRDPTWKRPASTSAEVLILSQVPVRCCWNRGTEKFRGIVSRTKNHALLKMPLHLKDIKKHYNEICRDGNMVQKKINRGVEAVSFLLSLSSFISVRCTP